MGACKVKVCRICFAMDCQLHLLHENKELYKGYEAVTGLMLTHEEDLPRYLCTSCANQLMNCARFRHRSLQAHLMLLDILKNHDHLSLESIQAVTKTNHSDFDTEHMEEGSIFRDYKNEIKREDISIDPIATELAAEVKIEYSPDDLVGDDAVASCLVDVNDVVKEDVFDEASGDVDDRELGTGEDGLDGLPSGPEDKLSTVYCQSDDRPYRCEVCSKSFRSKSNLQNHMLTHSGEKPYTCDVCQSSFSRKCHFKSHLLIHSKDKPYTCDICQMSFRSKSQLKVHVIKHARDKQYKCDICTAAFSFKNHLKKHTLVHSDDRPYSCEVCKKSFRSKSNLQNHMSTHSGEKPFSCDICQTSFTRKCHFKNHMLIHSGDKPFTCEVCNTPFRKKSYLKVHMLIHTDEKPFTCVVCKNSFRTKSTLQSHMVRHFGDKPYPCDICKKSFPTNKSLHGHIVRIHTVRTH